MVTERAGERIQIEQHERNSETDEFPLSETLSLGAKINYFAFWKVQGSAGFAPHLNYNEEAKNSSFLAFLKGTSPERRQSN